jgi:GGDEF domain-containing protein
MMRITGQPDGVPGGGPQRAGVAITDVFTGIYATSCGRRMLQNDLYRMLAAHLAGNLLLVRDASSPKEEILQSADAAMYQAKT